MNTMNICGSLSVIATFLLTLSPGVWSDSSQLSCLMEPSARVRISSQIPGIVSQLKKERGDSVKKGELLLELENSLEAAQVRAAKIRTDFNARQEQRNVDIYEKGFLSESRRDEVLTEKLLGEVALEEAAARLKRKTVYSPVDGVVVSRQVSVGEYVDDDPVLELARLDPLYAEVLMQAEKYQTITTGMEVQVKVDGIEQPYTGLVTIVDRVIDPSSGTFGVRIELENKELEIPAGVNCHAQFSMAE